MSLRTSGSGGLTPGPRPHRPGRGVAAGTFSADDFDPPETPLKVLIDAAKEMDAETREIALLKEEIRMMAQGVHQAYHGMHDPDSSHGTWESCERGICLSARRILNPSRKLGEK